MIRTVFAIFMLLTSPALAAEIEILPDHDLTPGSVFSNTLQLICRHATDRRGIMTPARRDEVLERYDLPTGPHPDYEIDHLVPLCLGGSDDLENLWPQPRGSIEPKWNAEAKDRLEKRLCALVCDGLLDIGDAQQAIITDWIAAYHCTTNRKTSSKVFILSFFSITY